ncbi:MAG: hypothetical protein SF028_14270 [Candidatus Sumerlaeia bacterium]|nr:hypothetical protein [Candidatus Sumerlaeia bacterium]
MFRRAATVFAAALLAAAASAGGPEATLRLVAQDLEGLPVPGATFRVAVESGLAESFETNEMGWVRVIHPAEAKVEAGLAADGFEVVNETAMRTATGATRVFRITKTDPERMFPEERAAFVRSYREVLDARRARGGDAPPAAAFLLPARRELPAMAAPAAADSGRSTVAAALVGPDGAPAPDVMAYLYRYDPGERAVALAASVRSGADGRVEFADVPAGEWHRIETERRGLERAIGPAFAAGRGGALDLGALPLLPPGRALRGMVFLGGEPAEGVLVESSGPGQPALRAVTGPSGAFTLAPLQRGAAVLRFSVATARLQGSFRLEAEVSEDELAVPLEYLPRE